MPIIIDLMDNDIIGPAIRQGRAEGKQTLIRRLIAKKYGPIPGWADERLNELSESELESITDRLLDAASLEILLG